MAVLKLHTSCSHLPTQPVRYGFNQFPTKKRNSRSRSTELSFPWTGSVLGDRLNLTDRFWFLTSCLQGSASPWHPHSLWSFKSAGWWRSVLSRCIFPRTFREKKKTHKKNLPWSSCNSAHAKTTSQVCLRAAAGEQWWAGRDEMWRGYRCRNASLWSLILYLEQTQTLQSKSRGHAKLKRHGAQKLVMNLQPVRLTNLKTGQSLNVRAVPARYSSCGRGHGENSVNKPGDKCVRE